MNRFRDMAIQNYTRRLAAVILYLVQWIRPFNPPTKKTLPQRTKHEVNQTIRCRDMTVRNFPVCKVGRSLVGQSVVRPQYIHCVSKETGPLLHVQITPTILF